MNKVVMIARLTKDPDVRIKTGDKNTVIAKFNIAVDRRFDREHTDFFNCIAFGKTAEFIEKYLHKGTKVAISGSIQNDNYTNKDGVAVYGIQIVVDEIEFAESKQRETKQDDNGFMSIPDGLTEDLPFN